MAKNVPEAAVNESKNTIVFASDVVSTIAGMAASEVEGIASMCNVTGGGILSKKKDLTKGVKVEVGTEEASVDLYINVEYGKPIQKAAQDAQESVRKAIESMTGLHVVRVDVHVQGVSFEKENNVLTAGEETAAISDGKTGEAAPEAKEPVKAEEATPVAEAAEVVTETAEEPAQESADAE